MDFDKILIKCGNNCRYQYLLLGLFGFVMFVTSIHSISQNVISFTTDYWCYHEQLENRSLDEIEAIYSKFKNPSCTRLESIDGNNITTSTKPCERWIYKYDFNFHGMNTELNWVCDSAYKARVGQSLFFVGSMCGTVIFGLLGDKIGRIKALILANCCGFVGDFSTIFTTSLTSFSISRYVSGLAADANSYLMYILSVEYVSPTLRNLGLSVASATFFSVGLISASWLAVAVGHWRTFLACSSVPMLLISLYYFLVQESAQWLVTRNDIDGAIVRLKRVAKFNGRRVHQQDFDEFRSYCLDNYNAKSDDDLHKEDNLLDMLRTPHMRSTTLKLVIIFMINTSCYNTIARNVEGLGISPFVMFTLNALTLPPSGILQGQVINRLGRKATVVSAMVITGLFATSSGLVMTQSANPSVILLVTLTLCTRFGISVCYGAGLQFTTELIPTSVRSRGLAAAHFAGAAASFLSPYILHLTLYIREGPPLILGLLFFTGAYVCLLLPDTRNKKLPISLEDGEEFGKGERMFDFLQNLRAGKQNCVEDDAPTQRLDGQQKLMSEQSS